MATQDFTIEDLLADAQSSGTPPAETALGLRKWREDMAAFGRTKHEPEEYWNRLEKLDQDLAPVLESLREQQGTSIIKNEVPEEQRSFFLAQYAKAKGDPAAMDPAFQETTTKLNGLTQDRTFSGNDSVSCSGKPRSRSMVKNDSGCAIPASASNGGATGPTKAVRGTRLPSNRFARGAKLRWAR